ncbi:sensor histidine kinase [Paenibacillus oralis]|uniref:histidine kinase n=1 Tax=Paenibacillus oralis TaxID=2490856 RepID=A0A3P3U1L2_9BACL|nr:sensor histidine kinase [Paenibacillus oralis]RRJ63519.1 sensor histidine kinase [Paenibacillus oralis]
MPNKRYGKSWELRRFTLNNLPIRYKLIVHFLLISILPSLGLGLLTNWTVDRIIERQITDNTLQLIGKVNKSLETYVENLQNMTYFISFNPEVLRFLEGQSEAGAGDGMRVDALAATEGDRAGALAKTGNVSGTGSGSSKLADRGEAAGTDHYEIRKFLQGFTTLYSEVAGILVVNSQGDYISNEMYARTPEKLTAEDWYKEAVRSKGIFKVIGHPHQRNVTTHVSYKDSEVVSAVRAILDPDTQQVKGVVLIDLKLRVIAETAQDIRLGKTGYLTVLDQEGQPIYAPPEPYTDNIPLDRMDLEGSGTYSARAGGRDLQFIYRVSPFTGWTTVGVFTMKESAAEMREIRFYVVSFVFVVCLLGMTASFYLAHSISRPIAQLTSFMQKAQSGDLTIRHWSDRTDEIGHLGRKFNAMLLQINRLISLTELQERQKREAELRSLQAHIKPHFLYNTLDTIHWMARRKSADDIAEMAESLSKLFRIGLSKGNDIIPLSDELEHVRSYLQIQHVRYQNKLDYTLHIAPELQGVYVLKLILQPIVENAIYHGIKERRGPGHIVIEAAEDGGALAITIRDDGKGIPPDRLAQLQRQLQFAGSAAAAESPGPKPESAPDSADGKGYGMLNVQARIALTFGAKYGIAIQSELGRGTVVTMTHPLIRDNNVRWERINHE